MSSATRRLVHALAGWTLTLGLVAIAVHPERCGTVDDDALDEAIAGAVGWFAANLGPDGDFLYRYDRERGEVEPGYNDVRHAGVLWSLWQAERAGVDGAGAVAELGFARMERLLVDTVVGPAVGSGPVLPTGTIALLVAALDERRLATGSRDHDELMRELGRTLVATVNPDGSVSADLDVVRGPGATRSPFFTGEVLWALTRLHLAFPADGFDEPALAVRRYLVEDRDRLEAHWPPITDHWGAYAFETMQRWPEPPPLTERERDWLERQLGLFGLQARYESQRTGGITRVTRGPIAVAAGVGTLGEGMGNHLLWLPGADTGVDLDDLRDRAECVAWLLVHRQHSPQDALDDAEPARTTGAWFRLGDTQMDDQQHALSALLLLAQVRARDPGAST